MKPKQMKAQEYRENKHKLTFPAYVQPKLNGFYGSAVKYDNEVKIYCGRNLSEQNNVQHINEYLNKILTNGDVLEGELYSDKVDFERLSGDLKSKDGRDCKYVEFHVFDHPIVMNDRDYQQHERFIQLQQYQDNGYFIYPLSLVETWIVNDMEDVERAFKYYVEELGHEGIMVRDMHATYQFGKRAKHIQKYKPLTDAEFEILDMVEGTGQHVGMVGKFKVKGACGEGNKVVTFETKAFGSHELRKKLFEEWNTPQTCKGKLVIIEWNEVLKSGKPRYGGSAKGLRLDV